MTLEETTQNEEFQPKVVVRKRFLSPVAIATKEQLLAAGIELPLDILDGVNTFELHVVDSENPILINASEPELYEQLKARGENVELLSA